MNYKNIAVREISDFSEGLPAPEMTLGQILYSFLRKNVSGLVDINSIKDVSDEDIYKMIEKAKQIERE
jgi:hypothetical protein